MVDVPWGKYPHLAADQEARRWLQFMANIGRAPNTIDAYGRAVDDHLRFCAAEGAEPLYGKADTVAAWIGEMLERPHARRRGKGASRAGPGLANATVQQRLVAVRSFYEFLVEDGLRERNPVRRGQAGRRGRRPKQGLVRRIEQAPWIPTEADWQRILEAARSEPLPSLRSTGRATSRRSTSPTR